MATMKEPRQWQALQAPNPGEVRRFRFRMGPVEAEGILLSTPDGPRAYHNRCPHAGTSLDWVPGRFLSEDGRYIVCQTHGACFDPATGKAVCGPTRNALQSLPLRMEKGHILVPQCFDDLLY